MRYLSAKFNLDMASDDSTLRQTCLDLIASYAGEAGFESFEETETGLLGYVQQAIFGASVSSGSSSGSSGGSSSGNSS